MANRIPDDRADRGGMTGATGNLTSDIADEEFVPAETREVTHPAKHAERRARVKDGGAELGGDERRDPADEHL